MGPPRQDRTGRACAPCWLRGIGLRVRIAPLLLREPPIEGWLRPDPAGFRPQTSSDAIAQAQVVFYERWARVGAQRNQGARWRSNLARRCSIPSAQRRPHRKLTAMPQATRGSFFLANGTAYAAGGLCEIAVEALR
jgi:hypothetical protein